MRNQPSLPQVAEESSFASGKFNKPTVSAMSRLNLREAEQLHYTMFITSD